MNNSSIPPWLRFEEDEPAVAHAIRWLDSNMLLDHEWRIREDNWDSPDCKTCALLAWANERPYYGLSSLLG